MAQTRTTVASKNGELVYSDGHPDVLCAVCEEEETDIRWGIAPSVTLQPICIYCANSRADAWTPIAYLGSS